MPKTKPKSKSKKKTQAQVSNNIYKGIAIVLVVF
jgi:UPF0755 protein